LLAVTPPNPYSDASSPSPGQSPQAAPARSVTEGMRQLAATALLAGNGVFLFLGVSNLIFVVTGWVTQFGARSEAGFDTFAGPVAIALPLLAMLLATHVQPAVPQARMILLGALAEYAVSGFFGVITYLGAFAEDVFSVRSTFNGLIGRAVWLAFLTIAAVAMFRVYRTMFPPMIRAPYSYGPTVYGRPYPGQPSYPRPGNYTPATFGPAQPTGTPGAPDGGHAPTYPPPSEAGADPTVRIAESAAEATRLIPPVPSQSPSPESDTASLPTQAAPPAETSVPGGTPER